MPSSPSHDPWVTVGIVTRNRPELLAQALASVFRQDYRPLEVLVIDDASEPPLVQMAAPPGVELGWSRYGKNRGLIVARNDMMRQARGDYFVSLDDDAYFTDEQDLSRAAAFLNPRMDIAALSFRILEPPLAAASLKANAGEPRATFTFYGCAHMLRRRVLAETGFYREVFFHQGEEPDLCYRIWEAGYQVFYFPKVTAVHCYTPQARDWERMAYFGPRNALLTIWINQPWPWLVVSTLNFLSKIIPHHIRHQTLGPCLRGIIRALRELPYARRQRRPVSHRTMSTMLRLKLKIRA
jgi:GT2 family glycosyltransferase